MKELSIEEKAKRYDEAIKLAKDSFNYPDYPGFIRADVVFPEIKELEDERIRKGILHLIGCASEIEWCKANVSIGEVQTWLEKQKERNTNTHLPSFDEAQGTPIVKQGEQKSIESMSEFKEGDILYNKDSYASDSIFIFKGMADKTNAYLCYARLYDGKDFSVYSKKDWDEGVGIYGGEFYPANHKQKELLFSEIEKAGYKWNSEKLELKKIEQNPAWSEEDETRLNTICGILKGLPLQQNWLKNLKYRVQPKQEWNEEDETVLHNACEFIRHRMSGFGGSNGSIGGMDYKVLYEKLKSLRPQNRWKPSDEMLEALYRVIPENVMEKSENEILLDKLYQGLKYGRVLSKE